MILLNIGVELFITKSTSMWFDALAKNFIKSFCSIRVYLIFMPFISCSNSLDLAMTINSAFSFLSLNNSDNAWIMTKLTAPNHTNIIFVFFCFSIGRFLEYKFFIYAKYIHNRKKSQKKRVYSLIISSSGNVTINVVPSCSLDMKSMDHHNFLIHFFAR